MKKLMENTRFREIFLVTIGAFILALSINSILLPNLLVAGGANGLAVVLHALFNWNIAIVLYMINIPLLVLCFIFLGKQTGLKTIYGSMSYPFFVWLTSGVAPLTDNLFLATIYGGVVTGVGLGFVFRAEASTGGTAIVSQIVHKYAKIPIGAAMSIVDGLVILTALIVFDIEIVLYSLICLFSIGRVVDAVQTGLGRYKNMLIISEKAPLLQQVLLEQLDKGVTRIPIEGGFDKTPKTLLMTTIKERDYSMIREHLLAIDSEAFIVSMNASEVHGKGFSIKRIMEQIDY